MRKKIRDLTLDDMPKCWNKLFEINEALMCMFMAKTEEEFNYIKSSVPDDILDIEIEF